MEMMISQPQRDLSKAPRLPVIYEEAVRDLIACQTLDEAKYFADKSDALAAWAKIYKADQAGIEAKRLKLHAYRRMGQLAAELRPVKRTGQGMAPGPNSILRENGLKLDQANTARQLARMKESDFFTMVDAPNPLSLAQVRGRRKFSHGYGGASDKWRLFAQQPQRWRYWMNSHSAKDLASGLLPDEADRAREVVLAMQEWLDEFDQYLPRSDG